MFHDAFETEKLGFYEIKYTDVISSLVKPSLFGSFVTCS